MGGVTIPHQFSSNTLLGSYCSTLDLTSFSRQLPMQLLRIQRNNWHFLDVINSSVANSFSSAAEEDSTSSVNELFSDNQGFLPSTTHCVTPLRCLICRNIVYYIAGFIVRKMNKVIKCQTCLQVLFSSRNTFLEASLVNIKMYNIHSKGGLIYTSWDVLNVLLHTETLFRKVSQIRKNFSHGEILNSVMKSSSHFFVNLDEHSATISSGIESHKLHLIKCLVSSFLILRMHKHAKVASQNLSQSGKRQKLSRSIIYQNLWCSFMYILY